MTTKKRDTIECKDHARSNKVNLCDNSTFHELKDKQCVPIRSFFQLSKLYGRKFFNGLYGLKSYCASSIKRGLCDDSIFHEPKR